MKFTPAEVQQLLSYAHARDKGWDGGWYYGNKKFFEKRHKEILAKLEHYYAAEESRKETK